MGPPPQRIIEVHLDEPLPRIEAEVRGHRYAGARVLVRLHRHPLGIVELDLGAGAVSAQRLAREVRAALGDTIDEHLAADGLPPSLTIPSGGLEPRRHPCANDATPAGRPLVSVVIATRGRPQLLETCVRSVLASSYRECEVLVVDNAPRDSATQRLVEASSEADARVRYLVESRQGAGVARNHGLARAKGEIVAFLDDDLVVDRDWLEATVAGFHVMPGVACVTALIMPLELETPAQQWLEEYGGFGKGFRRKVYDLDEHRLPDRLYPYSAGIFGSGASMAFETARLRELGGFDPRLATSGEDLDLFLKVLFGGGRIVYEPAALVWHRHPREYEALRRTVFNYGVGLSGLLTKWALSRPATAAAIAVRLPAAARLALDPRSRKNAGKRPGYPRELTRRELAGMALGPWLYLRAAWRARERRTP